ncbi:YDG domain-containing protein, partial [Polynucleobacter sp. MWH-Tro8-2-5-gr]
VINDANVASATKFTAVTLANGSQDNYALNASVNNALGSNTTNTVSLAKASLDISGITAANKVYDGTTLATISTSNIVYSGLRAGDVINTSATGVFNTPSVGVNKPVALTLVNTGSSLPNYAVTNQAYAYANITANSAPPSPPSPLPLPPNVNPVSPVVVPSSTQSAGLGVSFGPASIEESNTCGTKRACNCDATGTAGVEICYLIDVDSVKPKLQLSKLVGGKW